MRNDVELAVALVHRIVVGILADEIERLRQPAGLVLPNEILAAYVLESMRDIARFKVILDIPCIERLSIHKAAL